MLDFEPELVIFDKDGTLIDFHHMWGAWAKRLCTNLQSEGHLDDEGTAVLCDALGYDLETGAVDSRSPLCCTPMNRIKSICVDSVQRSHQASADASADVGAESGSGLAAVHDVWDMPHPVKDTKPLTDLVSLFTHLREDRDMQVAVCTTDDRGVTEETLALLKVDSMVDHIVCGDDEHLPPKPSPEQIWHICKQANVCPSKTVMVGDTLTDMRMGHDAGVGLIVGVPNGAGTLEDVSTHSDFVVASMDDFAHSVTTPHPLPQSLAN